MSEIIAGLVPIYVLIALGQILRRVRFPGDALWAPLEGLTYYVLFPALLLLNAATAPIQLGRLGPVLIVLIGATAAIVGLLLMLRNRLTLSGPGFTSVVQGATRFNTYVGIAAAGALYGPPGLAVLAVALAVMIPVVNLLTVAVLLRWGKGGKRGGGRLLPELLSNPLIIACLAGLALSITGIGIPEAVAPSLSVIAQAALPIGLMVVGAALDLSAAKTQWRACIMTAFVKLLLLPLIVLFACRLMKVEPFAAAIAVLFAALPPSPASYVIARRMGGDASLMAGLITWITLAAAVTLPLVLTLTAGS